MYWNDSKYLSWARNGGITPFDESIMNLEIECKGRILNPASVNLPISNQVRRLREYPEGEIVTIDYDDPNGVELVWGDVEESDEIVIAPGELVLLSSAHSVNIPANSVGILQMRSGGGRRGFEHSHSGFFDPGFTGDATFEVCNLTKSIAWRLRPGISLVQLIIGDTADLPTNSYLVTGSYNGQRGPTPFRVNL